MRGMSRQSQVWRDGPQAQGLLHQARRPCAAQGRATEPAATQADRAAASTICGAAGAAAKRRLPPARVAFSGDGSLDLDLDLKLIESMLWDVFVFLGLSMLRRLRCKKLRNYCKNGVCVCVSVCVCVCVCVCVYVPVSLCRYRVPKTRKNSKSNKSNKRISKNGGQIRKPFCC